MNEVEPYFVGESVEDAKAPKISVIVPVYKVEKYLAECIESVLAQTFTDFELILVDDGSPDNSEKICDTYAARDSRIRVFHKENGGVSSARNLGLERARGEWIAFVDSDDTVSSTYLKNLYGEKPPANTLVFSGLTYRDKDGNETNRLRFSAGERAVKEAFRSERLYLYGYPVSKLYDARLVSREHLRFDPEISMSEDMLFMTDYLTAASGIVFRENFADYNYISRTGSLSKRYANFDVEFKLVTRSRELFRKLFDSDSDLSKSTFSGIYFRAVNSLYRPPFPRRSTRFAKLNFAFSALGKNEIAAEKCSLRERLFLKKHFRIFDFVSTVLFRLRYGICEPLWNKYLNRKRASALRDHRKKLGGGIKNA